MYDYQRSPTGGWAAWGAMFSEINRVGDSALHNGYGLALIWGDTVGGTVYPFQQRVIRNVTVTVGGTDYTGQFESAQLPARWVNPAYTAATPGWGVTAFATIQSAINAAAAGDTIHVMAGTYQESLGGWRDLELFKSVKLIGAGSGLTIVELSGLQHGLAIRPDATGTVTVQGMTFTRRFGNIKSAGWAILVGETGGTFNNLVFRDVDVAWAEARNLHLANATYKNIVIENCNVHHAGAWGFSARGTIHSLTVTNSHFDDNGWQDPAHGIGFDLDMPVVVNQVAVTGSTFDRNQAKGINLVKTSNATFTDIDASSNGGAPGGGFGVSMWEWSGTSSNLVFTNATLNNNALDGFLIGSETGKTVSGVTIEGGSLSGNGRAGLFVYRAAGWGEGIIEDVSVSGAKVVSNGANGVAVVMPYEDVTATRNWWGAAEGPSGAGPGTGDTVSAGATYSPWWADEAMTRLVYEGDGAIGEDQTIGRGGAVTVPGTLTVGAGATLTVYGTLEVGALDLEDGAAIEVLGGELVLGTGGGTHTLSGSFVIYNSFGSIEILGDTEFSGDVLMLISDIHVADGVTLTVSGSLILDGCTVDCLDEGGRFAIEVTETGKLTLERTKLFDADLTLGGGASLVRNNQLTNVAIAVSAGATNNAVYHNVFLGTTALTDDGTGTVTELDGWGNVAALAETANDLALRLTLTGLGPNRTLDAQGNLFVQPGDLVRLELAVGKLLEKIQGVEAMLGFNSDYFDPSLPSSLGGVAPWNYVLHNVWATAGVFGKIDTAIGLDFEYPDPEGTSSDGTVAAIALQSRALEGVTQVYFRPRLLDDHPEAKTALTVNPPPGLNPSYRMPFTLNTGYITVDGTEPEIDNFTATQTQEAGAVDVFEPGVITHQGTVTFTVDATDALAGIDDADVILTLTLKSDPGVTLTSVLAGKTAMEVGGVAWTRYTFTTEIVPGTVNGVYEAVAKVLDRSGNLSDELIGEFTVQKNQVAVTVQLQGGAAGPFTRDVVFTAATGALGELKVWTKAVEFTDGVGTVTLLEAPDGMVYLDAKTDWTLRVRVGCAPDGDGQSTAAFTDSSQLPGGDLNGDNRVNMLDYAILRYFWYTAETKADITGDSSVNLSDFNVLQSNWYGMGAPAAQ